MELLIETNIVCPKCGNMNYMRRIEGATGTFKYKCINCYMVKQILLQVLKIEKIPNSYLLHQERYLEDILEKFGLKDCKEIGTTEPCLSDKEDDEELFDPTTYRSAVGSLIYLAICTRPDIMFSVNKVAQHCKEPKVKDWRNIIQIFRYLKGAKYYGILFNGEECLKTYVDSDYANDKETRRSTTGFIYFMGSGPTSWYSKL